MEGLETWQLLTIALLFVWSGFVRSALSFGGAVLTLPFLLMVRQRTAGVSADYRDPSAVLFFYYGSAVEAPAGQCRHRWLGELAIPALCIAVDDCSQADRGDGRDNSAGGHCQ